jgi:hypothetical protein
LGFKSLEGQVFGVLAGFSHTAATSVVVLQRILANAASKK